MAKTQSLDSSDLIVSIPKNRSATEQRGSGKVPSAELIPMQFRMTPEFVQAFKQEALNRRVKMNELLKACFAEYVKSKD